ncbi:NAD(P)-dependent dehydrogenase (short-subunit alcohol dehydrogenase family) [Streptomyces aurantiacus]|uniref:SDR family NAD(P)-dependent oxidoreductase n=1 Tax=Streptomyces aurantiacus TaxID=47760 RepID=UPI00278E1DE4|nr:SDR family NAD(P)-dependent oxidoreductase [Streptomyces aurantiacus]MDQ0772183.1 NAD(P)-dependent dehydrogenase (short-subunit alcohol dehydrogenase family) [Streptomyces aurantiacus]
MTQDVPSARPGRLAGRVAVISGAGSVGPGWGNGRATAVIFAREGATVYLTDRDKDALDVTAERIREEGGTAHTHLLDVTEPDAVQAYFQETERQAGRVDILVNNVGGSRAGGVAELSLEDWDGQLRTNLTSAFLACKHAVPVMRRGGGGSIVNTASASGLRWTGAAQVGYAAAKAAVIQLSRVTAVQYAPDSVRVNTVVPGQLHTPMVEARLAHQRADGDVDKLLAQRQARIPLGFMGDGRDTAYAALFLASDEARFVTGTEIVVDGGMTARCD